jgi:hypothetical protein
MPYKDPERERQYRKEWRERNKDYMKEYQKQYRIDNAQKLKDFELMRKYGLSREEHNKMRAVQSYRCAWCGRHEDELGQGAEGLCVDHCHDRSEGMLKHAPQIIVAIEAVAWFPLDSR